MKSVIGATLLLLLVGCTSNVPPKLLLTDIGSGRTFVTYQTWGGGNLIGIAFDDLKTGDRVILRSYTIHEISKGGYFQRDSEEISRYKQDLADVRSRHDTMAAEPVDSGTANPYRVPAAAPYR